MTKVRIMDLFLKSMTLKDSEPREFKNAVVEEVKRRGGRVNYFIVGSGVVDIGINDDAIAMELKDTLKTLPGVEIDAYPTELAEFIALHNQSIKKGNKS